MREENDDYDTEPNDLWPLVPADEDDEEAQDEAEDAREDAPAAQRGEGGRWEIVLAELGEAGWHTSGEPLADVDFEDMGLAHAFAEQRNKTVFRVFDWLDGPTKAWLAVRAGQLGKVRVKEPKETAPCGGGAAAPRHANQFC